MGASLTSGRLISKFGRYRFFPIFGTIMVTLAFWLFSHIAVDTNRAVLGVWMFVLGMGIGSVMPVLTLAVQNAVERRNLGSATSSVTFFRSIGASLGAAIFGAILSNRLAQHIVENIPVKRLPKA
jgi:MFS family permease